MIKTISKDESKSKRINVQKIASLKDLFNKPVNEIIFNIKSIKDIDKISDLVDEEGTTEVTININDENNEVLELYKNAQKSGMKTIDAIDEKIVEAVDPATALAS